MPYLQFLLMCLKFLNKSINWKKGGGVSEFFLGGGGGGVGVVGIE